MCVRVCVCERERESAAHVSNNTSAGTGVAMVKRLHGVVKMSHHHCPGLHRRLMYRPEREREEDRQRERKIGRERGR